MHTLSIYQLVRFCKASAPPCPHAPGIACRTRRAMEPSHPPWGNTEMQENFRETIGQHVFSRFFNHHIHGIPWIREAFSDLAFHSKSEQLATTCTPTEMTSVPSPVSCDERRRCRASSHNLPTFTSILSSSHQEARMEIARNSCLAQLGIAGLLTVCEALR